jgi:hypothetical protein
MTLFLTFIVALQQRAHHAKHDTERFFFQPSKSTEALPNFYPEDAKDVEDLTDFYHLTFQELRDGRESPRFLRLPSY